MTKKNTRKIKIRIVSDSIQVKSYHKIEMSGFQVVINNSSSSARAAFLTNEYLLKLSVLNPPILLLF
jgi:HKD family nuclease